MNSFVSKILEFVESDFKPISSFNMRDDLNRDIWDKNDKLYDNIRKKLLTVAQDFVKFLDIEIEVIDVTLTGSLANYNWSPYSDYDLHIIIDKSKVNDDIDLTNKYISNTEKLWKLNYDIKIYGYPVEIYCQDINDQHNSSGVYSILKNEWSIKPVKKDFEPDEKIIREKSAKYMSEIDYIQDKFNNGVPYEKVKPLFKKISKRLRDSRNAGLIREGEMSYENLVYKLLRRNGYIDKLQNLKKEFYLKKFE